MAADRFSTDKRQAKHRDSSVIPCLSSSAFALLVLLLRCEFVYCLSGYDVIELHYQISEEVPSGTYVGDVLADANLTSLYGNDRSIVDRLRFRFMKQHSSPEFSIDFRFGVITVVSRIDREQMCLEHVMESAATSTESPCTVRLDVSVHPVEYFRIIRIIVRIDDVNDNAPEFPVSSSDRRRPMQLDILESAPIGSLLPLPLAVDHDSQRFSKLKYTLTVDDETMRISRQSGNIFPFQLVHKRHQHQSTDSVALETIEILDRENTAEYRLRVEATDSGSPPLSGSINVVVRVIDVNDNSPQFEKQLYEVAVPEDVAKHTSLIQVVATDRDDGVNGVISYSLDRMTSAAYGHLFSVDADTGLLSTISDLDRDRGPSTYRLTIVARDGSVADQLSGFTTVRINVTDVNDMAPEIVIDSLSVASATSTKDTEAAAAVVETVRVVENSRPGTPVAHVTVTDGDDGQSGKFNCSLIEDNHSSGQMTFIPFRLRRFDETEFQLVVADVNGEPPLIDRERRDEYLLAIVCTDFGHPVSMTSRQTVIVVVDDANDNTPEFERPVYKAELIENNYVGAIVAQTTARDRDVGLNAAIQYRLVYDIDDDGIVRDESENFNCDPTTGTITASRPLDRESLSPGGLVSFRVVATDAGTPPRSSSALVVVMVQDVNDNRPTFAENHFRFAVTENQPPGLAVGCVVATDRDSGANGEVVYSIVDSDGDQDLNQNDDVILQASSSRHIAQFSIDEETGVISTERVLDAEEASEYQLIVIVHDRGVPVLSASAKVTITVTDVNDNTPRFLFPVSPNADQVYVSPYSRSGHVITTLSATDPDKSFGAVEYHLIDDGRGPFAVDKSTGRVILISTTNGSDPHRPLADESDGRSFTLSVTAVDFGGLAASSQLTIIVNRSAVVDFRSGTMTSADYDTAVLGGGAILGHRRNLVAGLHVTLVASVVAISTVATIGLLVAILVVLVARRRKNYNRKYCVAALTSASAERQYNCRTAAEQASARQQGANVPRSPPMTLPRDGNGNGSVQAGSLPPAACAWYSTPADAEGYSWSTNAGGQRSATLGKNCDGRLMRRQDVLAEGSSNKTGSRRSPFGSPKLSAGVAPRLLHSYTDIHRQHVPYSSSIPHSMPLNDLDKPPSSGSGSAGGGGRLVLSATTTTTTIGPSLLASSVNVGAGSGDDGSNTDSGRGPSEEDAGELVSSSVPLCHAVQPAVSGRHDVPSVGRYYRIDISSIDQANGCFLPLSQYEQPRQHEPSDYRSTRRPFADNENNQISSVSASIRPCTSSRSTCGFDSNKRVRFQTLPAATVASGNGIDDCRYELADNNCSPLSAAGSSLERRNRRYKSNGRNELNQNVRKDDDDDDDGGTTTSGSYDPSELCNEIDRLFFAQNTTI